MRRLLATVLLVCGLAAVPTSSPAAAPDCLRALAGLDLQTATIPELQTAMADGRITSAQLVDAYLARIDAYDKRLNSIRVLAASARDQAAQLDAERTAGHLRGPLHGIPVLLKDNYNTTDMPTTAGSLALEGVVPKDEATVTRRLRDVGAIILGKTNLSEFAGWVDLSMPPGYSSLAGQVVNANDFNYTPSGSSSGSGVAASMAFSDVTMGTETSGSILSPSDANGDVGVKTTLGLASRFGILPLAPDFDVPGPIVRDVTSAAIVLGAIAGADPRDPATAGATSHMPPGGDYTPALKPDALKGVTLTYAQDTHDNLDDERKAIFDNAIALVQKLGAKVTPTRSLGRSQNYGLSEIGAIPNEFKASFNQYLAQEMPNAKVHSLSDVIAFNNQHPDRVKYGQNLLQASDASPGRSELFPAQAAPTQQGARGTIDGALAETGAQAVLTPGNANANIGAAAGYPTVIVPMGYFNHGTRPFGLGFMGQAFTEQKLLGFAYAFEQATHARRAPTDINSRLTPASCPPPGSALGPADASSGAGSPAAGGPASGALRPLGLRVRGRRHAISLVIRHAVASRLKIVVRRGRRLVTRRTVRARRGTARVRIRPLARGRYRVTVLDPGPPPRTASGRVRVR